MKNKTTSNIFGLLWTCLCWLVSLDWLPEAPHIRLINIEHDDVLVKSAYRAVSTGSTVDWIEREVAFCAEQCKTKAGKEICLSFLKDHKEWKQIMKQHLCTSLTNRKDHT